MLRSSARATTKRVLETKRPSAKALSLAAESPLTMDEMAFISSGLSYTVKVSRDRNASLALCGSGERGQVQ